MSRIVVASQLPDVFNSVFAQHVADADIVAVPPGLAAPLPPKARVLVAAPFRKAGGILPGQPPPGWPFDVRWVQLVSVGIDFYPDWLFEGPVVTSARGSSAVALAEFALAAILVEAKRLPDIWIDQASHWAPRQLKLVAGSTLGLVGFGAIGEALAPRAQALGINVLAVRRSDAPIPVAGVERVADLKTLFERSDHVVLAAPATPQTERIVNRDLLLHAKPGLHLINIARGALIDDEALLAALDEGRVGRASLDVTFPEPLPEGHPFYVHPKVRLSPHTSVHTPDTRINLATQFAENLARFRSGAPLADVVDLSRGY
ncbi:MULTISPECIES: D-isomer specific 2-hydroxyacid dehydrogenase family protein [unclassified Caulobacter]|uniref:D-isomer specific 2-hydroxyacid dehydrogenase family protein n=1 Tax=unclassified Caulobacter TaxID=2648921 RepID=UPI0006F1D566|nr:MULTISPECIES: D-isomer specific 2-hydroxyacid dehydrogenase family protein [unclassified Caulobacter]KQV56891.1 dihydrofolate reductase [Caulobacter sp. Root342]KQV72530.1 dihydrofolate reductase [Caulobacter sp. Root343]